MENMRERFLNIQVQYVFNWSFRGRGENEKVEVIIYFIDVEMYIIFYIFFFLKSGCVLNFKVFLVEVELQ